MKSLYKIEDYNLPLKQNLPTFHYDLATHCYYFLKIHKKHFPPYLETLHDKMSCYAKERKNVKPPKFDRTIRIYIIDHRLNIPLILIDKTGDLANWSWKFAKYERPFEEYIFGDGDIFSPFPGQSWNEYGLKDFIKNYSFVPIEEFAMPSLVIFRESKLEETRLLSNFQVNFFLMKFKNENIVNWESILSDPFLSYDNDSNF